MSNFNARIPTHIRKRKQVSLKRFKTLAEDDREWYQLSYGRAKYMHILPPIPNPQVALLTKKLKKYKISFTTTEKDGYITFKEKKK